MNYRAAIMRRLLEAEGTEVPLPELMRVIDFKRVTSYITNLRKDYGATITTRTQEINGQRHTWYRLVDKGTWHE